MFDSWRRWIGGGGILGVICLKTGFGGSVVLGMGFLCVQVGLILRLGLVDII